MLPISVKFLNSGLLIIHTDNALNEILIEKINKEERETIHSQKGETKIRLPAGDYSVTVSKSSFQATQTVEVKRQKTVEYNICPGSAYSVEPVINQGGFDLAVSERLMRFIDYDTHKLNSLRDNSLVTPFATDVRFASINWVSPDFGLGQDDSNNLYVIENDQVSKLTLPAEGNFSRKLISAPSDKEKFFVSDGKSIFRGDYNKNYRKLYESEAEKMVLKTRGDLLLFLEIENFEEGVNPQAETKLINSSGEVKKVGQTADDVAVSPGGNYFSLNTGESIVIMSQSLKKVGVLPSVESGRMEWLDDKTLLFSKESELWSYNTQAQKSSLIANMPLAPLILELQVDETRQYVYVVVGAEDNTGVQIKRVGLKSQKIAESLIQLQDILPLTVDDCEIDLVNFSHLIITATPIFTHESCVSKAQGALGSRSIDLSSIDFRDVESTENE